MVSFEFGLDSFFSGCDDTTLVMSRDRLSLLDMARHGNLNKLLMCDFEKH